MIIRPKPKYKKGDIVKIIDDNLVGIVIKSEWVDYYVEGRPIKTIEEERVHISNDQGLNIISANKITLL